MVYVAAIVIILAVLASLLALARHDAREETDNETLQANVDTLKKAHLVDDHIDRLDDVTIEQLREALNNRT